MPDAAPKCSSLPRLALMLGVGSFLAAMVLSITPWVERGPVIAEALVYLALLPLLACLPAIKAYWARIDNSQKTFYAAAICLLLVGHIARHDRGLFPLAFWQMYGQAAEQEPQLMVAYVGVTPQGERAPITPGHAFPALGRGTQRLSNYLQALVVARSLAATPAEKQAIEQRLRHVLLAVRNELNRTRPGRPLDRIEVYTSQVDLRERNTALQHRLLLSTAGGSR